MSIIEALAPDNDSGRHLRISNVTRGTNQWGDYIRIDGEINNGHGTCIFVDNKDFELAEPYIQRWVDNEPNVTVPVFWGRDERWKFSSNSARRDLGLTPQLDSGAGAASYERERPTIKGEIAERCRREAGRRHLSVSELTMLLLDQSLPPL